MQISHISSTTQRATVNNNTDQFKPFRDKLSEILRKNLALKKSSEKYSEDDLCDKNIKSIIDDELWNGVEDFSKLSDNISFGMRQIIKEVKEFSFILENIGLCNASLWENRDVPRTHLLLLDALANKEDIEYLSLLANNIATNENSFYCRLPLNINEALKNNWIISLGQDTTAEQPISKGHFITSLASGEAIETSNYGGGYLYKKIPTTTDELIEKIVMIVNNNKNIRIDSLSLFQNEIKSHHIEKLAEALSGKQVNGLLLACNTTIGKKGINILSKYIKNIKIKFLDLDGCSIDFESAKLLIENLPETIKHIILSNNMLTPSERSIISSMLQSRGISFSIER